jgi:RNA recognition motif-containing protein
MDIFVGSIPFKLQESELRAVFEKFGEVSAVKIIVDKITRQNKGFGFVTMPDPEHAREAIKQLHGTEMLGRIIIVSTSEEKQKISRQKKGVRSDKNPEQLLGKKENTKESITWRKEFFRKKPKPSVATYGEKKKEDKGAAGRKKAKNFKVGGRRKRNK